MKSRDINSQSGNDISQYERAAELWESDELPTAEKIDSFARYVGRPALAKFLTKYEIYKRILPINGSIVECGVLHGGGTLAWAKLSNMLEPANHTRRIIGFDTFEGFPSIDEKDTEGGTSLELKKGGLTGSTLESVKQGVEVYDLNRPVSHIPKVELVKGDLAKTAHQYIADHPHTVISMLYLDVDLYEPTKAALEAFLPRMPKGALVVFDQLNAKIFPGETLAVDEVMGLANIKIERFPFDSYVSFAEIQ